MKSIFDKCGSRDRCDQSSLIFNLDRACCTEAEGCALIAGDATNHIVCASFPAANSALCKYLTKFSRQFSDNLVRFFWRKAYD